MTSPIQIGPLVDKVNAWESGKKQQWIVKNYPGFANFDNELYKRVKLEKAKRNGKQK